MRMAHIYTVNIVDRIVRLGTASPYNTRVLQSQSSAVKTRDTIVLIRELNVGVLIGCLVPSVSPLL